MWCSCATHIPSMSQSELVVYEIRSSSSIVWRVVLGTSRDGDNFEGLYQEPSAHQGCIMCGPRGAPLSTCTSLSACLKTFYFPVSDSLCQREM